MSNQYPSRAVRPGLQVLVLIASGWPAAGGCYQWNTAPSGAQHVDANWVGERKSVTVYDAQGRAFEAAALEIRSGPRLPYEVPDIPEALLYGGLPLLAGERGSLMAPAELPPGNFVIVAGRMTTPDAATMGGAAHWRCPEVRREHVIRLRGKPRASDHLTINDMGGRETWELGRE